MSIDVLPMGAKAENNTAVGVAATDGGLLKTVKDWQTTETAVITSDDYIVPNSLEDYDDIVEYGGFDKSAQYLQLRSDNLKPISLRPAFRDSAAASLFIKNLPRHAFTISLYTPYRIAGEYIGNKTFYDPSGSRFSYSCKGSAFYMMITPDDWEILQWLPQINICLSINEKIIEPEIVDDQPVAIDYTKPIPIVQQGSTVGFWVYVGDTWRLLTTTDSFQIYTITKR